MGIITNTFRLVWEDVSILARLDIGVCSYLRVNMKILLF